jgi:DNA-binding NarL/FixJ family response regulator
MQSTKVRRRRVLLIDPDPVYRAGLEELLGTMFWTALPSSDNDVERADYDAIWMEWDLRDPAISGRDLMLRARRASPDAVIMIVTSSDDVREARRAATAVGAEVFTKRETQIAAARLTEIEDARIAPMNRVGAGR